MKATMLASVLLLLPLPAHSGQATATDATPESGREELRIGIRFEGFLPGSIDPQLAGVFEVDFRIYLSPQGGDAIWEESQTVEVRGGRMDLVLGLERKIPMSIHEATFKFLGASVDGAREVYPRFPIVNVVFVSPKEALLASADRPERGGDADPEPRTYGGAYSHAGVAIESETAPAATWVQALLGARARGGDLPDYQDWYRSLGACSEKELLDRSGHYEWVLPWVYDTASHGRYNRYFRGRFEGCDYMDLSPKREYPYRIAVPLKHSDDRAAATQ